MVAIKTLLMSTALLTSGAFARIKSMYVDKDTVQAGQNVTVTLRNLGYIQNWDDFSVIWGLKLPDITGEQNIGLRIGYDTLFGTDLGQERPNITISVAIPENTYPNEQYVFTAAIPYLVAASGHTDFTYLTHNLTVTEAM